MIIPSQLLTQIQSPLNELKSTTLLTITCKCGKIQVIATRSLIRKWGNKSEYLCKSCHVKSYTSNPKRIQKFQMSFSKTSQTEEHKKKCSLGGQKVWTNPATRQKIIEAVRKDNLENPKKKISRAIALKVLMNQSNYPEHLAKMRQLAHESIEEKCKNDKEYGKRFLLNLKLDKPETKEKHRLSTGKETKRRWENKEYREKMTKIFQIITSSPEYRHTHSILMTQILSNPEIREKLSKSSKKLWQSKQYRDNLISKLSEAGIKKWTDSNYRQTMATIRSNQSGKLSKPQATLYQVLDDLKINYYKEGSETHIIKTCFPFDCVIPIQNNMKKHLIIEVQSYWHTFPHQKATDQAKFTIIDRHFSDYQMMYIWENEFSNKNLVIERLKATLEIDIIQNDFDFDDVIITDQIPFIDYRSFLDAYHYVREDLGNKIFGAYLNNKLIACVLFQENKEHKDTRKLSRLYIHPCYQKNNFNDWLKLKILNFH